MMMQSVAIWMTWRLSIEVLLVFGNHIAALMIDRFKHSKVISWPLLPPEGSSKGLQYLEMTSEAITDILDMI
jgi:hypothetical protein